MHPRFCPEQSFKSLHFYNSSLNCLYTHASVGASVYDGNSQNLERQRMRKILTFLYSLPARFPFISGVIFSYLFTCALIWLFCVSLPKPGPSDPGVSTGNLSLLFALLLDAACKLALRMGVIALIADLCLIFLSRKLVSPHTQVLFSTLFWLSLVLGFYPFLVVNELTFHLQSKAGQIIETIQYQYFASPDAKLRHELDKQFPQNILLYLQEGADLNIQNARGNTPLMVAVQNQEFTLATKLIQRGANVHVVNYMGQNALDILLSPMAWQTLTSISPSPEKEQLAFLLLTKQIDLSDPLNMNCSKLLQGAVSTGSIPLVKQLLIHQPRKHFPNAVESCATSSPLFLAAERGDTAMVAFLISKGAKIDIPEPINLRTPLMASIVNKHPDTAMLLISKGANINAEDKWGDSVLTLALQYHTNIVMIEDKVVHTLMKAKAKSNCRVSDGQIIIISGYNEQVCPEAY